MAANPTLLPDIRIDEPELLARHVAAAMENAIVYGEFPDGYRLTEEIVCRKTGVSRSPIREAFRLLENDGLVVREPRRGVRVSELSVEELDQLYACRIALESTAAQLAAREATSAEIDGVRSSHQECVRMFEAGDVQGHFHANVEMSRRIFHASHNKPLIRLLSSIHKQAIRYRFIAYQQSRTARANSVKCNAEFVDALERRDAETAGIKARETIELAHGLIRKCVEERSRGVVVAPLGPKRST